MHNAVIVGAVRTAVGRKNGKLAGVRPDDLLADTLKALVERVKIDPSEIEDVVMGCVDQVGEQGFNIARNAALDELRRRKRRATLEAEPAAAAAASAEEIADPFRRAAVRAALATLDKRERDLVALKFQGGLSNAEIARVLGISESNAGTKLHRTITKLREACHDRA